MKKILAIALIPMTLLWSCSDDDQAAQDPQPNMPPESSMAPNFENFEDDGARAETVNNWAYAATSVGIYSAILYSNLAVPVTAFKIGLKQDATYNTETNLWVWEYDISVPNKGSYAVRLTADVDGTNVDWTGYISLAGSFEDFVWFEGESNLNADAGSWTLYESPDNPSAWLSVNWSDNEATGVATSTFNVEKEGNFFESSITYTADANADFNRSVVIVDTNASNTIEVDWNKPSGEGRVKSEAHFEDTAYHCWDKTLNDTDCPS
ncbi:hypothetical protein SAMN05421640_3380 [Ekhidna lutea]|uniref:Uncharacterized protein n=1 Tax=Ekhidna lutea TaxID=447679 RepID=A0A239LPL4_EKHLU|nr:hypothetical protein [Ekhidna lutea]SNT31584.1 hypothetical protein SAMN05421640_3380 [Ekhidna lutea]